MKRRLNVFLAILASGIVPAIAGPEPGLYAGTVTITKNLHAEGLSSTYTLKAKGRVAPDGSITLLTTIPEAPSAAIDLDSGVTRASLGISWTPFPNPVGTPLPKIRNFQEGYIVDGQFPAQVEINGRLLTLSYTMPKNPPPVQVSPNHVIAQFSPKNVVIRFKLLKQTERSPSSH